jgi:hypothetical protein
MSVAEDVGRIAEAAAAFAGPGEELAGVVAVDTLGRRVYLCAFESSEGHAWLALGAAGEPLTDRRLVRDAASLAALCEVAEETAGGGDLTALRATLADLRRREAPEGIEEAETAALELEQTLQPEPRLATTAYLDALGVASRRLEQALGEESGSPFAAALQQALPAVEELAAEVERRYKGPLT